jgi:ribosomal protein S12 methylthiotransferase
VTRRKNLPVLSDRKSPASPFEGVPGGSRIGLITLGCDKNTVDSERILATLAGNGADVQNGTRNVDVIVINTCGFIDQAKEESIEAILDAVKLKQQGRVKAVVAMGCLVQRYRDELIQEIPEADAFLGLTETDQLVPVLRARGLLGDEPASIMERPLRLMSTRTPHTSYLKISEGCDHTCAFCAIPLMRGKHRSTPVDILVREAQELEQRGVVELNIVSQDTTWYGRDVARGIVNEAKDYFMGAPFKGMPNVATIPVVRHASPSPSPSKQDLSFLLRTLIEATDIPWLRLFYMYPSGITRELVDLIASEPRILPYLDMPLQHGSDRILQLMRRPERQATIRERVQWLRSAVPDLSLRTTLIVGFPGETEDDFQQTIDLLEEIRVDYVGAFTYSHEEGTLAAGMEDSVPESLKRERLEQLLDVQRTITLDRNEQRIGTVQNAIVDKASNAGVAIGRTKGQALEVDGVVTINQARGVKPGDLVRVRITDAGDNDLEGVLTGDDGD